MALAPLELSLPQYRVLALLGDGSTASSVLARPPRGEPADRHRGGRRSRRARAGRAPGRPRATAAASRCSSRRGGRTLLRGGRRRGRRAPRRDRRVSRSRTTAPRLDALEPRARPQPRRTREARHVTVEMGAFGADVTSPFVPVGRHAAYPPPRAQHRPRPAAARGCAACSRSCSRTRGCSSLLVGRRRSSGSIGPGADPERDPGQAIDDASAKTTADLEHFVAMHRGPRASCASCCNYVSRNYLLRTAYRIEYDLRNIMYEHLSRMSFSFYDRVQSGQLISRANSDIRSVQMYLAFAPIDPRPVQRRRPRVRRRCCSINVPLALVDDVDDAVRASSSASRCASSCSRCRGSSRRASPRSRRSSTRTSTACAS